LALNPVAAQPLVSEDCGDQNFATLTPTSTTNAAFDQQGPPLNSTDRIVVTAGVAQTLFDQLCFFDASNNESFAPPTPQPWVDVNGSPTPITYTSNSTHALLALYTNGGPTPSPGSFGQTGSIADTSMDTAGNCVAYNLLLDGALTQPATLTLKNNLTATNPYTSANYGVTEVVTIVPLSVSTPSAAIAQGAITTTTVTGSDFKGTGGLTPFASVDANGNGSGPGTCVDNTATVRATVAQVSAINTTTWLQAFTITPAASPTLTGTVTCTFVLADVNTGTNSLLLPGYVVTPTVTVTVNQ
jgi:hypothetical protein